MRTRVFVILSVLAMALAIVPTASADGGSSRGNAFHASVDGWETGIIPGASIPEGRCPTSAGWILLTAGDGEADGLGTFHYTTEHCAWLVETTPARFVGKLAAGIMVLDFEDGELTLAFQGNWRFDGNLNTGEGIGTFNQSYEVIDGTGIFAGASGHGSMDGVDDVHNILMDLHGGLKLVE